MKSNIKNVTIQLSQEKLSFLMTSVNAKYFMDIMSHLTASFTLGDDGTEPCLVYGPTAFFHLYELAERWNIPPENVLCVMLDLEQNGLVRYTFSEREYAIEPCISSFMATDDVGFRGTACDTPLEELDIEQMPAEEAAETIAYYEGLTTLTIPMVVLKGFSLAKDEDKDDYENRNGAIVNL